MSKRLLTLAFFAVLCVGASAWLARSAQAGPPAVCGDGTITPPEQCDDSNTTTGDGCSFPSCLPEVCGDSVVNPDPPSNEQCDDGNTVDDDNCSNTCQSNCGNNVINGTEACDDGNTVNGDGCENDCTITIVNTVALTKDEQGCVNAVNKNLSGVEKAQNSDDASCAKSIASGKDPGTCLGADTNGKVAKAQGKTTATFTGKKCTGLTPPFGLTDATTVNTAGSVQILLGLGTVFGIPPTLATNATDKPGAACQTEVLKQFNAVNGKYTSEALKAKKTALKGGKNNTPPAATSAAELGAGIDAAITASTALAKAESKANTNIAKKCLDPQVDPLFDCGGATTANALTLCTIAAAKEAACTALEMSDNIPLTCPSDL